MRRYHPTAWAAVLLGAAGLVAGSLPGRSQEFARSIQLYAGGTSDTEGMRLGGWGSGLAAEDRAYKTAGDISIKVDTAGYYAGARINFQQPKDISAQVKDPYGFLEFVIRFQPGRPKSMPGGPGGMYGSPSTDSSSAGAMGATGFPDPYGGGQQTLSPDTKKLKVMLICEEGSFTATNFPVTLYPAQEEGWFSVAIPFVAFKGTINGQTESIDKADSAKVREVRIFGDNKDTFWIGEIRTTTDDEPISVDALDELEVSVGEAVEFTATATGGISPLQYTWDFDLSDGLQEDATGATVVQVFRKPSKEVPGQPGELQPYVVTVIVRDLSGAKKPVRRQANVIVNP
jgi:hypothetical protein